MILCTVRLGAALFGFACTLVFSWFESTNALVETGRSWRARTQQLLSAGRRPLPPSQLRLLLAVQRAAADRTATELAYYDTAPLLGSGSGGGGGKKVAAGAKKQQLQMAVLQQHQQEWVDENDLPVEHQLMAIK